MFSNKRTLKMFLNVCLKSVNNWDAGSSLANQVALWVLNTVRQA
jgi:DNA-binding transcriptional regulator YiaG